MKKRGIYLGILALAGILILSTAVRSQTRSGATWEYASVWGRPLTSNVTSTSSQFKKIWQGIAQICYATPEGCRFEEITTEGDYEREGAIAMMTAAAKLGNDGWELTSATEAPYTSLVERTLFFRRQRK